MMKNSCIQSDAQALLSFKPFIFLRHGETDWNYQGIYMGSQDIPLNKTGEDQAIQTANILKNKNLKHIFTSPFIRAKKTAEIIGNQLGIAITIIDELAEVSWGIYEGKPKNEQIEKNWLEGLTHSGAESAKEVEKRVLQGFKKAFHCKAAPILIVAHGGTYCAIQRVLGWPFILLKNCSPLYHKPPVQPMESWMIEPVTDVG